jgi:predicted nuclease of predicted toxin-antitoxin system
MVEKAGHEVFSVYEQVRGLDDNFIIEKALNENYLLITNDKDFGEKVFREKQEHNGIILLRLEDERPATKIETIKLLLENHSNKLAGNFVVATEKGVRFARYT